jgi:hypothetical protein
MQAPRESSGPTASGVVRNSDTARHTRQSSILTAGRPQHRGRSRPRRQLTPSPPTQSSGPMESRGPKSSDVRRLSGYGSDRTTQMYSLRTHPNPLILDPMWPAPYRSPTLQRCRTDDTSRGHPILLPSNGVRAGSLTNNCPAKRSPAPFGLASPTSMPSELSAFGPDGTERAGSDPLRHSRLDP